MAIIRKIRKFLGGEKGVIHKPEAKVIHTDPKILAKMDAESIRKSEEARQAQCGSEVYAKDIIVGLDCGTVDKSMCVEVKSEFQIQQQKLEQVKEIADYLNLKFNFHDLKKINKEHVNAFEISNNLVYFYPLNDGMPRCGFEFYKNDKLIIDNDKEYSQISNLDEILLQMVRIFNQSLDNRIVLDPYYFMLELTDEICENYHGSANLVITEKAIRNQKLNEENFDEATKYFINHFLDHFIGWNFGLSVNRNEDLKRELEELNEKVIDMGIREWAGPGFEVYGVEDEAYDGLQHYKLPTEKEKVKKKTLNKN